MGWSGYYAKDGSYVKEEPIYNDSTIDAMQRERQNDKVDKERAEKSKKFWDDYYRERDERRERERIAEERRWEESYQRVSQRHDEQTQRRNAVKNWMKRSAFSRLVSKVSGRTKKFEELDREFLRGSLEDRDRIIGEMESATKFKGK